MTNWGVVIPGGCAPPFQVRDADLAYEPPSPNEATLSDGTVVRFLDAEPAYRVLERARAVLALRR